MSKREKPACPYGSMCFATEPAHLVRFSHTLREDPVTSVSSPERDPPGSASPSLSFDLMAALEPIEAAPSPVVIDLLDSSASRPASLDCAQDDAYANGDEVLDLVSASPAEPETKKVRLKKRKMTMALQSSSEEEVEEQGNNFSKILSHGAFKANGAPGTGWIDTRRVARNIDPDEEHFLPSDFSDNEEEDDEELDCPCGMSFKSWYEMEEHLRTAHERADVVSPVKEKVGGRGGRLRKRNAQKMAAPAAPVKRTRPTNTGPSSMDELLQMCQTFSAELEAELVDPDNAALISEQPESFPKNRQLKAHQIAGLNWLYLLHQKKRNGILGDEMGCGKTVQVIALLTYLKEKGQRCSAIIVVPVSVVSNWHAELERWSPTLNVCLYFGTQNERLSLQLDCEDDEDGVDVYLTTYSTVVNDVDRRWLKRRAVEYLIVDEAHEVRNAETQKHRALVKLGAARRLLLTGTPLHNNLQELLTLLYFLNPTLLGNFKSYEAVLADATDNDGDLDEEEARLNSISSIRSVLNPFLLRRTKQEVLQLPEKKALRVRCDMSPNVQAELYKSFTRSKQLEWQGGKGAGASRNICMDLRQAACSPLMLRCIYTDEQCEDIARLLKQRVDPYWGQKREKVVHTCLCMTDFELHSLCTQHDFLKQYALDPDILVETSGKVQALLKLMKQFEAEDKRVLIFSQFTKFLSIVQSVFDTKGIRYLRLDGQTPAMDRQRLIDEFDEDKGIRAFLLSTKAGGVGITLTGASCVVFLDLSFNPQWDRQAEDRCHRIGQDKPVFVYKLLAKNSIDETIYKVGKEKLALGNAILLEGDQEGAGDEKASAGDVKNILARYFASAATASDKNVPDVVEANIEEEEEEEEEGGEKEEGAKEGEGRDDGVDENHADVDVFEV